MWFGLIHQTLNTIRDSLWSTTRASSLFDFVSVGGIARQLGMEREAKKRKMEYTDDDQEEKQKEDDEEEEMEKFFALLRSTKQMHDQLRRNSNRIFKEKEEIKKAGEERVSVAWNPSFLPEDFLEEDGRDSPAAAAGGPSKRKEEEKKEEGEEGTGLDLKLSL